MTAPLGETFMSRNTTRGEEATRSSTTLPGLGRRLAAAGEARPGQAQRIAGPGWRLAQGADRAALDAGLDEPGLKFRKAVGVRRGHERDQDHGILVSGPILRFVNNPPGAHVDQLDTANFSAPHSGLPNLDFY